MPTPAARRVVRSRNRAARGDLLPFLRAWLAAPLRVAAIAPSGPALARAITAEIGPESMPVIEFGPGTGVFTQAILDAGVEPDRLVMVEAGAAFAALMRERFPRVRLIEASAGDLADVPLFGPGAAGAVVSGLPILSMPKPVVRAILAKAFSELRPGGAMFQFTYGYRCPVADAVLDELGLAARRPRRCSSMPRRRASTGSNGADGAAHGNFRFIESPLSTGAGGVRMNRFLTAVAALTVAGAAAGASVAPEDQIARALAGRTAGKPTDCIWQRDIRSTQIVDRTAILYEMRDGTIILNRPTSGREFLRRDLALVTKSYSDQLCGVDIVRLYDPVARFENGSIGLGPFVPYARTR